MTALVGWPRVFVLSRREGADVGDFNYAKRFIESRERRGELG